VFSYLELGDMLQTKHLEKSYFPVVADVCAPLSYSVEPMAANISRKLAEEDPSVVPNG
jgi:hypothetical protein